MTWLAFIFALEAGFAAQTELMFTAPEWDRSSLEAGYQLASPYVQLEAAGEAFDFLQLGGSAQIFISDDYGWLYAPYDARFLFFLRVNTAGFTAGWEHICIHPISSQSRPLVGWLFGGGDRIYLRYEGKIPVRRK